MMSMHIVGGSHKIVCQLVSAMVLWSSEYLQSSRFEVTNLFYIIAQRQCQTLPGVSFAYVPLSTTISATESSLLQLLPFTDVINSRPERNKSSSVLILLDGHSLIIRLEYISSETTSLNVDHRTKLGQ
jgi:hypothetical protein